MSEEVKVFSSPVVNEDYWKRRLSAARDENNHQQQSLFTQQQNSPDRLVEVHPLDSITIQSSPKSISSDNTNALLTMISNHDRKLQHSKSKRKLLENHPSQRHILLQRLVEVAISTFSYYFSWFSKNIAIIESDCTLTILSKVCIANSF